MVLNAHDYQAHEGSKSHTNLIGMGTNSVPAKESGSKDYSETIENSFGLESYSDCQTSILVGKGLVSSMGSTGASTLGQDSVLMSDTSVGSNRSQCETSTTYRETWLVQEFCDKGSLSEFLQAGNFVNPMGQGQNMVCFTPCPQKSQILGQSILYHLTGLIGWPAHCCSESLVDAAAGSYYKNRTGHCTWNDVPPWQQHCAWRPEEQQCSYSAKCN